MILDALRLFYHRLKNQKFKKYFTFLISVPSGRNLWVSGLASTTRATDLKTLFSKYGKVTIIIFNLIGFAVNRNQNKKNFMKCMLHISLLK